MRAAASGRREAAAPLTSRPHVPGCRQLVSFGGARGRPQIAAANIRRGLLLTQLSLSLSLSLSLQPLVSCRGDDAPSAGTASTSPSAHLDGETCALVGNAARLRVGAIEPRAGSTQGGKALPFLVESTGCAPSCTVSDDERELSRIPGTNGDALRALQNLPGVARPPAIAGLLIVRGAAPNETNIYVDGTLVPIVYHFGGLSSVIPTEMLEKIDFFPGNFSTCYGRVTGAIVDVGVRSPKVHKDKGIHGLAQADLIDARFLVEGPLWETGWKFAVAGRRSYVDVWLKPVLEQAGAGVTTAPVYYDYQLMLQKDFDKKSSLRLFFFGSDDRLEVPASAATSRSVPRFIASRPGTWPS